MLPDKNPPFFLTGHDGRAAPAARLPPSRAREGDTPFKDEPLEGLDRFMDPKIQLVDSASRDYVPAGPTGGGRNA